ncbi:MAG: hypothetical protein HRF45_00280 [Fimbriimonadia bacterium]|jgi:hypothetical protein
MTAFRALGILAALSGVWLVGCTSERTAAASPLAFPESTQARVVDTRVAGERLIVRTAMKEVPHPISDPTDPKTVYAFLSTGYARRADAAAGMQAILRVEVFAEQREDLSYADRVCLYLLRLWDMLSGRLDMDHPLQYRRTVSVFLKRDGRPGGEQRITVGPDENGRPIKRNTIHIYDIASLTDPMQICRELAHEYGHAVLPAIGGFREPEEWINGLMGERLFLRWLLEEMEAGRIPPAEAFDLQPDTLKTWLAPRVDRLSAEVLSKGISSPAELRESDRFLGFVLAVDSVYGAKLLGRGLMLANGNRPEDVLKGITQAIGEHEERKLNVPKEANGKPFWTLLPGSGWKLEGAKLIEARDGGWVRIEPTSSVISVKRPTKP